MGSATARGLTRRFFIPHILLKSKNQKETIMPRGGRRPGAGRPRKPTPPLQVNPFDLTDRLNRMPGGRRGRRARFILAMSAFGASETEVAAALDVCPGQLSKSDRDQMQTGRCVAEMNILDQMWTKARAGNVTALLWLHRRITFADRRHPV